MSTLNSLVAEHSNHSLPGDSRHTRSSSRDALRDMSRDASRDVLRDMPRDASRDNAQGPVSILDELAYRT